MMKRHHKMAPQAFWWFFPLGGGTITLQNISFFHQN